MLQLSKHHSWKQLSFCCPDISRFLHKCRQNTYTQDTYNGPLYIYINVCMYLWPHWKLLHTLCSCAGYGPCGTVTRYFNCSAVNNTVYLKVFVITLETTKVHAKGQRYNIRNTWSFNKNVHKCKLYVMKCNLFAFYKSKLGYSPVDTHILSNIIHTMLKES